LGLNYQGIILDFESRHNSNNLSNHNELILDQINKSLKKEFIIPEFERKDRNSKKDLKDKKDLPLVHQ